MRLRFSSSTVITHKGICVAETLITSGKAINGDHNSCAKCVWYWGLQDEACVHGAMSCTVSAQAAHHKDVGL